MTTYKQVDPAARPHTITIIGWLFVTTGILSVVAGPALFIYQPVIRETWNNLGINFVLVATGLFISGSFYIVSGLAILQGKSWGRTLYFIFGFILVVLCFNIYHEMLLAILSGLLPYSVLVWQLTRKASTAWFASA